MPPLISPAPGDVAVGVLISMQCDTEDVDIFYTMDGTNPVAGESAKYEEPFALNEEGAYIVRAIAAGGGRKRPSTMAEVHYTVVLPDHLKKIWKIDESVWAPRLTESQSKDFYDTPKLLREQFELDWRRCISKTTFSKFLVKTIREGQMLEMSNQAVEEELEQVKQEIWEDYDIMCNAFSFYAACSSGDGFSMKLNA